MAIVTLKDIHVAFGTEIVLDHLDLNLYPGEKVGMVGANGSGKSTIIKLITGQINPDVAKRICATPGDMNLLALSVQVYGQPHIEKHIPGIEPA